MDINRIINHFVTHRLKRALTRWRRRLSS